MEIQNLEKVVSPTYFVIWKNDIVVELLSIWKSLLQCGIINKRKEPKLLDGIWPIKHKIFGLVN
jgi:hypothetical protein